MNSPQAKGKNQSLPQLLEGQVVVVQAADLVQTKTLIPDLETWIQCFSLFAATLLPHHPGRLAEFMAYQSIIAKASTRYKWPSRIIYDQSFRQDVESNPSQSLAKVEPGIYAPAGHSVNDGIEKELSSLHYISIDDVVACIVRLGKDTILAKIDVKQAYRIVPVNPSDRQLLGMLWGRQSVC